jgi:hypothetical protein
MIMSAPLLEDGTTEGSSGQVELHLQSDGGAGVLTVASPTATPDAGQLVMEDDGGTIKHLDAVEALQERNRRAFPRDHGGDCRLDQALEEGRRRRATALVDPLR